MSDSDAVTNLLEVTDLRVEFDAPGGVVKAVDGVSFRIPPGGTVAVVGESGSGKSVTAQAIMGILPRNARIASGSIMLRDPNHEPVDIVKLNPNSAKMREIRGGRVSIIFQEPMTSLSPVHTIGDQIGEALLLHRDVNKQEARKLVQDMLALVGFPTPETSVDAYPFELSGGLRQRAMIAMALVCRPSLLIADEPTTALDVTIQAQILKLIKDLQAELHMAVLMITHDLGVVANVADEVVVMYHGKVMEQGAVKDIFRNPQHPYLKALLAAVPRFDMEEGERLVPIREIKPATGHLLADIEKKGKPGEPPLLDVQGLKKSFRVRSGIGDAKTFRAVDDVGFTIQRGECLGLVGESGCGKSTTSKMIMNALKPDEGQVLFNVDGEQIDLTHMSPKQLFPYRKRMQYMFQDPFSALNPRMTVREILLEPLIIHKVGDAAYRLEMARELMQLVGLDDRHLSRYPHSFSGGQRQRIGIARALALKPELILCDEPVSALDVSVQAQILNLLKDLQTRLGLTYLFVSHNLAVVDYMADRIAVMCAGRLVEIAPKAELFANPRHPYTQGLLAAVPEPDLDHPLDFAKLMGERASNPANWAAPYGLQPGAPAKLEEVAPNHFVRVAVNQKEAA
jgi:peptide/nickel transport system ATP-binding protein